MADDGIDQVACNDRDSPYDVGQPADNIFCKIGEMFYEKVGHEMTSSLPNFIESVKQAYLEKYSEPRPKKLIVFDSKCMPECVSVVVGSWIGPYIAQLNIRHETEDIEHLLKQLDGRLTAHYSALRPSEYPPDSCLNLVMSGQNLCRVQIEKSPAYRSIDERLQALTPMAKDLILSAESMDINDDVYDDDNPTHSLVHVRCRIKNSKGRYSFTYSVGEVALDPIPESFFPKADGVFSLVSNRLLLVYQGRVVDIPGGIR